MTTLITLENVTLSYNRHPAVHHISGQFETGSLTAIAGPNGAGKSTLLKGIAGILMPDEGRIIFHSILHEQIAYLPQSADLQRDFPMTLLHLVSTGFWQKTGRFGEITPNMKLEAIQALAAVGLEGFENRDLYSLSAGQFQRALFARLIVQNASLILLDEPFSSIDAESTAKLIEIMQTWHQEGRTILCVLHDFEQIRSYFPDCLLMARECIGWGATQDTLDPDRLIKARFFREGWASTPQPCERAS